MADEYMDMLGNPPEKPKPKKAAQNPELKESKSTRQPPRRSGAEPEKPKEKPKAKPQPVPVLPEDGVDAKIVAATIGDTRRYKVTNKEKETIRQTWSEENKVKAQSSMIEHMQSRATGKFGRDRVFTTREEAGLMSRGIPMPSLSMEYIFANDVFPLSCFMMLAGSWGSCKSALSYEFMRWFYEYGGFLAHVDAEAKFDAEFMCDIIRAPGRKMPGNSGRAESLEDAMEMTLSNVADFKAYLDGTKTEPGPGRSIAALFVWDSLAGAPSRESQEKILKEGSAGRAFPLEAMKLNQFLPTVKQAIDKWPFTFLAVNHLKEKADSNGNMQKYTPGGKALNFHESFELHNTGGKKIQNSQFDGLHVRIACTKNSFGPTGRQIRTRFLWWVEDDPETGRPQNKYVWDWDWSIVMLLNDIAGAEKARLNARGLGITVHNASAEVEATANFRAIGMSPGETLPVQEVGRLIHENPKVRQEIRDALNIQHREKLLMPHLELERAMQQGKG